MTGSSIIICVNASQGDPAKSLSDGGPDSARTGSRERQRRRTRTAVVVAAARMVQQGHEPTVAEAAEAAEVSRATAYRYFPTQDDLMSEAILELTLDGTGILGVSGLVDDIRRLVESVGDDVERIGAVVRRGAEWSYDNQRWLRRNLRSSLAGSAAEEGGYRRPGHRREWIELATAAVEHRMSAAGLAQLNAGLLALIGVEAIIALVDVGGYDRQTVLDTLQWAARALTETALKDAGGAR
jgi:AcrR family transcriptional regulator